MPRKQTQLKNSNKKFWKSLFTILDSTLFLVLFCAAIGFIWQAFLQYQSKDTSFKRAEKDVNEFPTITFCLIPRNHDVPDWGPPYKYILGKEFNISYAVIDEGVSWYNITSEGQLIISQYLETIHVEQIATIKNCYKVNASAPEFIGSVRGISLQFEPSLNKSELPENVPYHLTSEDNAYTVTFDKRMNGNVLKYEMNMGHWALQSIKAEKFLYLKETSGCTDLSFWEQWEPAYAGYAGFATCPKKCAAISLPNNRQVVKLKPILY